MTFGNFRDDSYEIVPMYSDSVRIIYRVPWGSLDDERYRRQVKRRCLVIAANDLGYSVKDLETKQELVLRELYAEWNQQALLIDIRVKKSQEDFP